MGCHMHNRAELCFALDSKSYLKTNAAVCLLKAIKSGNLLMSPESKILILFSLLLCSLASCFSDPLTHAAHPLSPSSAAFSHIN